MLASRIELVVVEQLRDLNAVHAGVVAFDGRAIVLPGTSHSDKSTLVRALLECGGTYLSDEFALVAEDGRVRPFPRLMTIRDEGGSARVTPASAAHVDSDPFEVAVVASLAFDAAAWHVEDASAADAVMAFIANGVTVKRAPNDAVAAYAAVARSASFLRGTRGEAAEAAERLVQVLRAL